jgi:hypothetical protein
MEIDRKRGHSLSWAVSPSEEEEILPSVSTSSFVDDTAGSYISFDASRR